MKRLMPIAAVLALAACAAPSHRADHAAAAPPDALYRTLGGQEGIATFVDAALKHIHGDARIASQFANTDMADLRRLLIEQICDVSGGPCKYSGRSMEEAHSGLHITDKDFDAFVEDLVAAMNEVRIAPATQKTILGVFGPMRPQVVGQ